MMEGDVKMCKAAFLATAKSLFKAQLGDMRSF